MLSRCAVRRASPVIFSGTRGQLISASSTPPFAAARLLRPAFHTTTKAAKSDPGESQTKEGYFSRDQWAATPLRALQMEVEVRDQSNVGLASVEPAHIPSSAPASASLSKTLWPPFQLIDLPQFERNAYKTYGPDYLEHFNEERASFALALADLRREEARILERHLGPDWYVMKREAIRRYNEMTSDTQARLIAMEARVVRSKTSDELTGPAKKALGTEFLKACDEWARRRGRKLRREVADQVCEKYGLDSTQSDYLYRFTEPLRYRAGHDLRTTALAQSEDPI